MHRRRRGRALAAPRPGASCSNRHCQPICAGNTVRRERRVLHAGDVGAREQAHGAPHLPPRAAAAVVPHERAPGALAGVQQQPGARRGAQVQRARAAVLGRLRAAGAQEQKVRAAAGLARQRLRRARPQRRRRGGGCASRAGCSLRSLEGNVHRGTTTHRVEGCRLVGSTPMDARCVTGRFPCVLPRRACAPRAQAHSHGVPANACAASPQRLCRPGKSRDNMARDPACGFTCRHAGTASSSAPSAPPAAAHAPAASWPAASLPFCPSGVPDSHALPPPSPSTRCPARCRFPRALQPVSATPSARLLRARAPAPT